MANILSIYFGLFQGRGVSVCNYSPFAFFSFHFDLRKSKYWTTNAMNNIGMDTMMEKVKFFIAHLLFDIHLSSNVPHF